MQELIQKLMFKKFIKDSLIYTIPSLVSKSTSFILIPLYSRILNPTEFGSFDLFLIFTNFMPTVMQNNKDERMSQIV